MNELTQDLVQSLFTYKNGNLYWKNDQCNRKIKSGNVAGSIDGRYYRVTISNKHYLTHRLIYLYHYGYLPKFIDHIDGDKLNNNIKNLRVVTLSQNQHNRKPNKNSSSIYKGVSWHKHKQMWISHIYMNKKLNHLGYFKSSMDAAKAYNIKSIELFGEYAKLNEVDN